MAPPRGWDPFRPLDMLTSLWSTAAVGPVSNGAAVAYRTVFTQLRRLVVGRTLTIRLDDGDLTLNVTEFDSRLDLASLSVGQLNDVQIAASDIEWNDTRFERATAVLHNVHVRPSAPPVLVAAPVDLTLDIQSTALDELIRWAVPRLSADIGADGIPRVRLAGRPGWGNLEVDATIDGSTLWLRPHGLTLRRSRLGLPTRMPAYPLRLPPLPSGLTLTGLTFQSGQMSISGTLREFRQPIPRKVLDDLLNQLSGMGTLNLSRLPRVL